PVDRASEPVAAHGGSADGVADVVGVEISVEPQRQDTLAERALEVARHGRVPRRVVECVRQRRDAGPAPDELAGALPGRTARPPPSGWAERRARSFASRSVTFGVPSPSSRPFTTSVTWPTM